MKCTTDIIELIARDGDAVCHVIELGDIAHIDPASEELPDEFLLFAIDSGLRKEWDDAFPDLRKALVTGSEGSS